MVEEGLNQLPYKTCSVVTPTGYSYDGVEFKHGNCGVSIMRSGKTSIGQLMNIYEQQNETIFFLNKISTKTDDYDDCTIKRCGINNWQLSELYKSFSRENASMYLG